jgi:hypothetical protein
LITIVVGVLFVIGLVYRTLILTGHVGSKNWARNSPRQMMVCGLFLTVIGALYLLVNMHSSAPHVIYGVCLMLFGASIAVEGKQRRGRVNT